MVSKAIPVYVWSDAEAKYHIPLVIDAIKIVLKEGLDVFQYFPLIRDSAEAVEKCFDRRKKAGPLRNPVQR